MRINIPNEPPVFAGGYAIQQHIRLTHKPFSRRRPQDHPLSFRLAAVVWMFSAVMPLPVSMGDDRQRHSALKHLP